MALKYVELKNDPIRHISGPTEQDSLGCPCKPHLNDPADDVDASSQHVVEVVHNTVGRDYTKFGVPFVHSGH